MDANTLRPFLSQTLTDRLCQHGGVHGQAVPQNMEGACLFFDISGFTDFNEKLSKEGARRTEFLSRVVTAIFEPIVDICLDAGGDVLYFVGDGLVIIFPTQAGESWEMAARRAVQVALSVVKLPVQRPFVGVELHVRAAVGAGDYRVMEVGGVDNRWMLFADGPAVTQAFQVDAHGRAGMVTISKDCREALDAEFECLKISEGIFRVHQGPLPQAVSPVTPQLSADVLPMALGYLSPALVQRIALSLEGWFAELRQVTVLFIAFPDIDLGSLELCQLLHQALGVAQEQMKRVEGTVHAVLGDKGIGLLCALGVPPHAHENDAARAIDAALAIETALLEMGLRVGIGIATGDVHCGLIGSARRKGYEMYGRCLPMAARLMQAVKGQGILVCPETQLAAKNAIRFDEGESLRLKGFNTPVRAFRPLGRQYLRPQHGGEMVGRSAIFKQIRRRIHASPFVGGSVLIQADAGMGKSLLLEQALFYARHQKVRVLRGAADSMEMRTTLYAFRTVIADIFGLHSGMAPSYARQQVQQQLQQLVPHRLQLMPLLNAVLHVDFDETPFTLQLTGSVRADNLITLLLEIFSKLSTQGSLIVAIDDLHWMDPASWSFCLRLIAQLPDVMLLSALRPMEQPPLELEALSTGEGRELHHLQTLSIEESTVIMARCLNVEQVGADVRDTIYRHSEGIPFFTEEVSYALRDAGAIHITDDHCTLSTEQVDIHLPVKVTGIITNRIDHLNLPVQLALKAASVLGRFFMLDALVSVHPLKPSREACRSLVEQLVATSLVVQEPKQVDHYFFRHALTHETTYQLLTAEQRQTLHKAAAEHIEATETDRSPFYARLAEHWRVAENAAQAAYYAGLAGEQAIATYDSRTAISHLSQALELDLAVRGPLSVDIRRARWHRMLGDAYYSIPDFDAACVHYQQTYACCGFPMPRFSWRSPIEIIRHIMGRYRAPKLPSETQRALCVEALQACDNLTAICLWRGDELSLAHVVFESDNIGRLAGISPEFAMARNMTGYALLLAGLRGVAESDLRQAHAMAERLDGLLAKVVTNVFLGLSLTTLARITEAEPYLRRGWDLSREFGAGLWRHRADFMLGEALLLTGRYAEAAPYFLSCAEIAKGAEPQTQGFAMSMWALCQLRKGTDPMQLIPVLEAQETGIPRVRKEKGHKLQLSVSIAIQMELFLRVGRLDEAYALVKECIDIVESGGDTYSYLRGSEAHTQIALTIHALWERKMQRWQNTVHLPEVEQLKADAQKSLKFLKRSSKTFVAVEPRYLLMQGIHARISGDMDQAQKRLMECVEKAEQYHFPWEEVVASMELARLPAVQAAPWVTRAQRVAEAHKMLWEVSEFPTIGIGFPKRNF